MTEKTGMKEKVSYWLNLADYDLKSAEVMLDNRMFLYVGFMCHQVIEKALKACVIRRDKGAPPFNHNLLLIAQKSSLYDEMEERQRHFLDILRPLNVECRYPTYREKLFEELTNEKCTGILQQIKELYKWIKDRL